MSQQVPLGSLGHNGYPLLLATIKSLRLQLSLAAGGFFLSGLVLYLLPKFHTSVVMSYSTPPCSIPGAGVRFSHVVIEEISHA